MNGRAGLGWSRRMAAVSALVIAVTLGVGLAAAGPSPGGTISYATNREPDMLDVTSGRRAMTAGSRRTSTTSCWRWIGLGRSCPGSPRAGRSRRTGGSIRSSSAGGVEFHDGTPFDSRAVKFQLRPYRGPRYQEHERDRLDG